MALGKTFKLSQSQVSTSVKNELCVSHVDVGGFNETVCKL